MDVIKNILARYKYVATVLLFLIAVSIVDVQQKTGKENRLNLLYYDPLYADDTRFSITVKDLLEAQGIKVDYFLGSEANVEALKKTTKEYDVWLLRVHSTVHNNRVWFFTGEEYDESKYILEQITDDVHRARPSLSSRYYFAVGSDFVHRFMNDRFSNAVIIVMGCDGFNGDDLAQAFLENGAVAYMSWDGPVSLTHTDNAVIYLLETFVNEKRSLGKALAATMEAIGPDPNYSSRLVLAPETASELRITYKDERPVRIN